MYLTYNFPIHTIKINYMYWKIKSMWNQTLNKIIKDKSPKTYPINEYNLVIKCKTSKTEKQENLYFTNGN